MCVFSANMYPVCFRLLLYGKYCSHVESAISLLDFICKEKEGVRLKLEVHNCLIFCHIYNISSHFIMYFIMHLLYVAGMFEESQQWEIHFERLTCSSHAACAEVPTTASGIVKCTYTPTLLSLLYIVFFQHFELTLGESTSHFWGSKLHTVLCWNEPLRLSY